MFGRRALSALTTMLLVIALASFTAGQASADPVPAPYTGSTTGDIVDADVDALPELSVPNTLAGLVVGHAQTDVDSTSDPRTSAIASNLEPTLAGDHPSVYAEFRSEQPGGPSSDDGTLADVPLDPLLRASLITGETQVNWAGAEACVDPADPLARASTEVADTTVGQLDLSGLDLSAIPDPLGLIPADLGDLTLATLGTARTQGAVELVPNGLPNDSRNVVSTTEASIETSDLLTVAGDGPLATLDVLAPATLTATSDGADGTVEYDAPEVTVTLDDGTVIDPTVDPVPAMTLAADANGDPLLEGQITVEVLPAATDESVGAQAEGSVVAVLSVGIEVTGVGLLAPLGVVASADLALLPMSATALAPAGGVECSFDTPVITSPPDGSSTTDTTPTVEGTGEPGAEIEVLIDGEPAGTTTVDEDGNWSLELTEPLAPGEHTVDATQTIAGGPTDQAPQVTFTVVEDAAAAPEPPVITSPEDGSTTADSTPQITGTGEPGAEIEVIIDGEPVGTTTVDEDGNWSLELSEPLADGEHTVDAVQTTDGTVQQAEPVTFTVDTLGPPVITSPEDGSTTDDSTPTIAGTGEPGAVVTVYVDGQPVGATPVDANGVWSLELTDPLSCGGHTTSATQSEGGAVSGAAETVSFTVACVAAAGAGALPDTGTPSGLALLFALGLLLTAGGIVMMRRGRIGGAL